MKDGKFAAKSGEKVIKDEKGNYKTEVDKKGYTKQEDGSYTNEKGQTASMDEDGKLFRDVKKEDLQTKPQTYTGRGYRGAGDKMSKLRDRFTPLSKSKEAGNTTSDSGKSNEHQKTADNDTKFSKQDTPPSGESSTGSNPSNTHNSTTYPNTAQGGLAKARDNLQSLKNATPTEHAKAEMQMLTAEKAAGLDQALASGQITSAENKQKMAGVNSLMSKLDGGSEIDIVDTQKAGITAKELSSAGMSNKTVTTGTGKSFQVKRQKSGRMGILLTTATMRP